MADATQRDPKSRGRMVGTTARLLQRQGYHATGLRQILAESGAPRGSLYFHFPGGKEQLAVEAVQGAQARTGQAIAMMLAASDDPGEAVAGFVRAFGEMLRASDFAEGCPIATITLEAAATSEPIRAACAASFATWQGLVRDYLVRGGIAAARADDLALLVLCAVEGGLILSRAQRDIAPLERIARQLVPILRAARGDSGKRRRRSG